MAVEKGCQALEVDHHRSHAIIFSHIHNVLDLGFVIFPS